MAARFLVPLLLVALLEGGCATVLQGSHQKVSVFSEPPAARVEVDGVQAGNTPVKVRLKRGKTHIMQVSKDGYEESTLTLESTVNGGWAILDVLFGLIPIAVDALTSDWETFKPSFDIHLVRNADVAVPAVAVAVSPPDDIAVAINAAEPVFVADSTDPRVGMLRLLDRKLVAFPVDGGTIQAKIHVHWRAKNVELRFGEGLHVGDDGFGSFSKDRIVLQEGSEAYVRTSRGRVLHLRVTALDWEAVELEWADQSVGKVPANAVHTVGSSQPAPVDSVGPLGGMLRLLNDEPVEFPVDGGVLLAKIHGNDVELRFGEGIQVGYERAGPFDNNRITVDVGSNFYVLTRRGRLVHVRCTSLEAGEAAIEWMRK